MLDTQAMVRSLTEADFTPTQADAVTKLVRQATEQADHVTADQFKVGIVEVRAEIAEVRTETTKQIADLDNRQTNQHAELRVAIAQLELRLSKQHDSYIHWLVGTAIAAVAMLVAIMGLLGYSVP